MVVGRRTWDSAPSGFDTFRNRQVFCRAVCTWSEPALRRSASARFAVRGPVAALDPWWSADPADIRQNGSGRSCFQLRKMRTRIRPFELILLYANKLGCLLTNLHDDLESDVLPCWESTAGLSAIQRLSRPSDQTYLAVHQCLKSNSRTGKSSTRDSHYRKSWSCHLPGESPAGSRRWILGIRLRHRVSLPVKLGVVPCPRRKH